MIKNKMFLCVVWILIFSCDNKHEYYEGLAVVEDWRTKKYGFIDKSNNLVIDKAYDYASRFEGGFSVVGIGTKKRGVINKKGEIIVPLKYDNIKNLGNGYFRVYENLFKPNELVGLVDKKNETIIPFISKKIRMLPNNFFLVKLKDDKNNWYIYNNKGDKISEGIGDNQVGDGNYNIERYEYYNDFIIFNNRVIYNLKNPKSTLNGYYKGISFAKKHKVQSNMLFKVINSNDYKNYEPGILDFTGENILQKGVFNNIRGEFNDGLIVAVIPEIGEGFVNTNGDLVIKPIFDSAESFSEGVSRVTLHDKIFYIDINGLCVQDCPSNKWYSHYDFTNDFSVNKEKYTYYLNKGLKNSSLKNYNESIELFSKAIMEYPLDYEAYYNKSLSLYLNRDMYKALKEIDKAIVLNPNKSESYYIKGCILGDYQQKDAYGRKYIPYYDAIDEVIKAINIDPYNLDYYNKLVYLSGKDGQKDMACYFMMKGCGLGDNELCNGYKKYCTGFINYDDVIEYIELRKRYDW
jgi:tetratricopeptide (TPR) repeat protein